SWSHDLTLGAELEVVIRSGETEAVVPFVILDPELARPRGLARTLRLDELLEILAGRREVAVSDADLGERAEAVTVAEALRRPGDAFAWRKLMRATAGLRRDVAAGIRFPAEVRRLLDGPLGARALL